RPRTAAPAPARRRVRAPHRAPAPAPALAALTGDRPRAAPPPRLTLPPLDAAAIAELGAAPELVPQLLEASGGNPFFVEELLRNVAEGGVPEGVRDVLAQRLARLRRPARGRLGVGSRGRRGCTAGGLRAGA